MNELDKKFQKLGVDNAPGQNTATKGESPNNANILVDFSHGDVDAFEPIPESLNTFIEGVNLGGEQAYTEYKGDGIIRKVVAEKLEYFTNTDIDYLSEMIITPGTQGALFLAIGSLVTKNDKVAIIEPDYFANRKIVEFLEANIISIELDYLNTKTGAGLNFNKLEEVFKTGVKLFIFSNPNNPTGAIYSEVEIKEIAKLAKKYNVNVIIDQLYSRLLYENNDFTHFCALDKELYENIVTITGPSKTESLSGYRLGVAFGSARIIERMEKLQAIVSLRAGGYNQSVLKLWFAEPEHWLEDRIKKHQLIRDEIISKFKEVEDLVKVRTTEAGSYLFPEVLRLNINIKEFVEKLRYQENVIVTPGTEFGPQFTNSFRINFSQDYENTVEAINRIIRVIKECSS